jgi:hypothetical protein
MKMSTLIALTAGAELIEKFAQRLRTIIAEIRVVT